MTILLTENPGYNTYVNSLILAYQKAGHQVICGSNNFFWSNIKPDLLHIHWPERLYKWYVLRKPGKEQYNYIKERLEKFKNSGTKIIYTVHNLLPHHSNEQDDYNFYNLIIEYADVIHHHCPKSIDLVGEKFPKAKEKINIVANHGDYLIDFKKTDKYSSRRKLDIPENKFVILNFGSQQRYKGNDLINKTFNKLNINNKFLLTAGNFRYDTFPFPKNYLLKIKNHFSEKSNSRTRKYIFRSIHPDEIPTIFSASDLVFLGHTNGLTSGVLNLAATFSRPVVFPDIGCFEYQMQEWVYEKYKAGDADSAKISIEKLYSKIVGSNINLNNSRWLEINSWDNYVNKILANFN